MSKAAQLAALIGSGQAQGDKNLIINGAMQVAQRSTSLTVGDSTEYKTLDRYAIAINGTTAGRATMSQATDAPSGFGSSMKFDVTTADTSIGAGEAFGFAQRIEGQNLQQLAKGTSDAKACTLSFYAKGTAKTYVVETRDANSRQVSATFSVTTSWQRFEITIPADTAGTIADDNTTELQIIWWLHAGSDFTSGTLNTSWATSVNANRMVGCGSIFSSTDNELLITGVQLEVGDVATPFEHESYAATLQKCQRYFQKRVFSDADAIWVGANYTGTSAYGVIEHIVTMRTEPSGAYSGTLADYKYYTANGNKTPSAMTINSRNSENSSETHIDWSGALNANGAGWLRAAGTGAFVQLEAEL
tara:strand:- start:17 stop:1096 length:1080 start_codon:yes stop_codon:yes gene_type:complete